MADVAALICATAVDAAARQRTSATRMDRFMDVALKDRKRKLPPFGHAGPDPGGPDTDAILGGFSAECNGLGARERLAGAEFPKPRVPRSVLSLFGR